MVAIPTALLALAICVLGSAQEPGHEVSVFKSLPVVSDGTGGGEHIALLLDRRLVPGLQAALWNNGDWSFALAAGSPAFNAFSVEPPADARLELRRRNGSVIEVRDLARPLARLAPWNSAAPGSVFLVTVDLSSGWGSYSGPETEIVDVSGGHLRDAEATGVGGKSAQIHLAETLKSEWRIIDRGAGAQILAVACRPDASLRFVMDYTRFSLVAGRWTERQREAPGFWEADQPFPPVSAFPSAPGSETP